MKNHRIDVIKKLTTLGGAGLLASTPVGSIASAIEKEGRYETAGDKPFTISILQTTDVHCQVHPHDELFWENDKAIFRKTGGYAQIATCLNNYKKHHPDTFIID